MKFTKPTKTRHGIFSDSDEMEFDDSDTWPLSELIRLDNVNIDDRNILFAINATIHPLEHATALIITNDVEGWKKGGGLIYDLITVVAKYGFYTSFMTLFLF